MQVRELANQLSLNEQSEYRVTYLIDWLII